jgi:hypothetical protein
MSQNLCAKTHKLRPALLRLSLLGTFLLAAVALFGNTGCEDKAIGRPCDVLTDAGNSQGVFNTEALECPSRICLKPVVQSGAQHADSSHNSLLLRQLLSRQRLRWTNATSMQPHDRSLHRHAL